MNDSQICGVVSIRLNSLMNVPSTALTFKDRNVVQ